MSGERALWQAVVFKAMLDATHASPGKGNSEQARASRDARSWINGGGRDFRTVCALAGMDPDFIRDAYRAGRISHKALKSREEAA